MSHCILLHNVVCFFMYVSLYLWRQRSANVFFLYVVNAILFQTSRRRNTEDESLNSPCKKQISKIHVVYHSFVRIVGTRVLLRF